MQTSTSPVWRELPVDLTRLILSQPSIPCETKVELQKSMGPLSNKVKVPRGLETKLGRILKRRVALPCRNGQVTRLYKTYDAQHKDVYLEILLLKNHDIPCYNMYIKKEYGKLRHFTMSNNANGTSWQTASMKHYVTDDMQ
jgi:hypothetical protein